MTVINLFKKAEPIVQQSKKSITPQLVVSGLEKYAAICTAYKALEDEKKNAKISLDNFLFSYFAREGVKNHSKPSNFKGTENKTIASMQLRKRSSRTPLNVEEQETLSRNNIPFESSNNGSDTYIFNPEHINWVKKNSSRISAALTQLGAPIDIIQQQISSPNFIVTDETIETVFKKNINIIDMLLPIVSTTAIAPDEIPIGKAWSIVRKLFSKKKEVK